MSHTYNKLTCYTHKCGTCHHGDTARSECAECAYSPFTDNGQCQWEPVRDVVVHGVVSKIDDVPDDDPSLAVFEPIDMTQTIEQ